MIRLFCIANRNARRFRKYPELLKNLERFFPTTAGKLCLTSTLAEAENAFELAARDRPDTIILCGGDGTLHHALNRLIALYQGDPLPKILIIPAGTMNVVFHSLPKNRSRQELDFEHIFHELVANQTKSKTALPLAKCNDTFGFIFGIGGFANFVNWYRNCPDPTPTRAIRLVTQLMIGKAMGFESAKRIFAAFSAKIHEDGQMQPTTTYRSISYSCVSHIGFRFHLYPDAQTENKKLGSFNLRGSETNLFFHTPVFFMNKKPKSKAFDQRAIDTADIKLEEAQRWMMDGEMFPAETSFAIGKGPTLTFV